MPRSKYLAAAGVSLCVSWSGSSFAEVQAANPGTAAPAPATTPPAAPAPSLASAGSTPATDSAPVEQTTPAPAAAPAAIDIETASFVSELQKKIRAQHDKGLELQRRVGELKANNALPPDEVGKYAEQVAFYRQVLGSLEDRVNAIAEDASAVAAIDDQETKAADVRRLRDRKTAIERELKLVDTGLAAIESRLEEAEGASGWSLVETILRARCATAICFDNGAEKRHWLGIEPLVELPVGKSFALSRSALSNYVDNHELRIDLAAGVRVWLFRDIISLSLYISKPLTDGRIRLEGSPFVYPAASVRRPYPGLALGLLFDTIWVGFDRDELRNGDGQDDLALNTDFPPNAIISSTWTLTVAIQPVTAFRSAIGTAVQSSKRRGSQ